MSRKCYNSNKIMDLEQKGDGVIGVVAGEGGGGVIIGVAVGLGACRLKSWMGGRCTGCRRHPYGTKFYAVLL
jgi:hypothetical protein